MPSLFSVIPCQYFFFHFVLFCEANTVLSFLCILHYNFTWNFYPALFTYFHWIQHTFLFPLRLLRLMDYLELHCLVSTCLEIVPLSFCNWFLVWVCVIRGYPLYDVNPFKFRACFITRNMIYLANTHLKELCVLLLLDGMSSKCQWGLNGWCIVQVFYILVDCLLVLSIIYRVILKSQTIIGDLSISPCISTHLHGLWNSIRCISIRTVISSW